MFPTSAKPLGFIPTVRLLAGRSVLHNFKGWEFTLYMILSEHLLISYLTQCDLKIVSRRQTLEESQTNFRPPPLPPNKQPSCKNHIGNQLLRTHQHLSNLGILSRS